MSGNDVLVPENGADPVLEVVIIPAAGIGLVPLHQSRPLVIAHGRGAAVRQQINRDAFGRNLEQIVARTAQQAIPLPTGRAFDWLNDLDLERFRGKLHDIDLWNRDNSPRNACASAYSKT